MDISEPRREGAAEPGTALNELGGAEPMPGGRRDVAVDEATECTDGRLVGRGVVRRMYEMSGDTGRESVAVLRVGVGAADRATRGVAWESSEGCVGETSSTVPSSPR